MSWTDDRVATLKELWLKGHTASAIAKRLGDTTRNAVISKAHRMGLPGRGSPIVRGTKPKQPKQPKRWQPKRRVRSNPTRVVKRVHGGPRKDYALDEAPIYPTCQFPEGDSGDWRFCGAPAVGGRPYCQAHCEIAYREVS